MNRGLLMACKPRTLMITSGITAPHMLCDSSSCQLAHFAVHVQHLLLSVTPCPTVPCSAIVVGCVDYCTARFPERWDVGGGDGGRIKGASEEKRSSGRRRTQNVLP